MGQDRMMGNLRAALAELQDLVQYLENRDSVQGADASYCREKTKYVARQLKQFRKAVDHQQHDDPWPFRMCWN